MNSTSTGTKKELVITVTSNKLSDAGIKNLFFAMDKFIESMTESTEKIAC